MHRRRWLILVRFGLKGWLNLGRFGLKRWLNLVRFGLKRWLNLERFVKVLRGDSYSIGNRHTLNITKKSRAFLILQAYRDVYGVVQGQSQLLKVA